MAILIRNYLNGAPSLRTPRLYVPLGANQLESGAIHLTEPFHGASLQTDLGLFPGTCTKTSPVSFLMSAMTPASFVSPSVIDRW